MLVTTSEMGCNDRCSYLAVKGLKGAGGMKSCSKGTQRNPQNLSAGASLWVCDTSLSILCISCKVIAQISLQLNEKGGLLIGSSEFQMALVLVWKVLLLSSWHMALQHSCSVETPPEDSSDGETLKKFCANVKRQMGLLFFSIFRLLFIFLLSSVQHTVYIPDLVYEEKGTKSQNHTGSKYFKTILSN